MKYRHSILALWLKGPAMPLSVPRVGLLCILVLCGAASTAMADDRPEGRVEELASAPPSTLEKSYDLVVLRPFGLFQVATGSVILVAAYLPALAFDGEDDVVRACYREPVDRTFRRPLGRL